MYDIFYVSKNLIKKENWEKFKNKFIWAEKLENVSNFDDIKNKSFTDLFYVVWDENFDHLIDFNFSYKVPDYDKKYIHVFKNNNTQINIFSKHHSVSQQEFEQKNFLNKKTIQLSKTIYQKKSQSNIVKENVYDIVFISYNEPNADINFNNIKKRFPKIKRIHGIKGIHKAHIAAAKLVNTSMFWVVDGDAEILDDFSFEYFVENSHKDFVHVWRSKNPVNDLVYGYGGVKLLPTLLTINMDTSKPDMTTSISNKFKPVNIISNITVFNTDPFNTWKSAFRECAKLSSKIIDRQKDNETIKRLETWCNVGKDKPFGKYAIDGARSGREFGESNIGNIEKLKLINDFDWLKEIFKKHE